MMTRADFCDAAKEIITTDRNEQYGEPEDNFGVIAELWSAYLSNRYGEHGQFIELFSEDVGVMMALFKIARMVTALEAKDDNFIDAIGYLACAGEMNARCSAELERCMSEARASVTGLTADDLAATQEKIDRWRRGEGVAAERAYLDAMPMGKEENEVDLDEIAESVDEAAPMHKDSVPHVCATCRFTDRETPCKPGTDCKDCARWIDNECRCDAAEFDPRLRSEECPGWESPESVCISCARNLKKCWCELVGGCDKCRFATRESINGVVWVGCKACKGGIFKCCDSFELRDDEEEIAAELDGLETAAKGEEG